MPRTALPCVLDYDDHRAFLRDHYAARKRADPRWSYGAFARKAGLASRSHYQLVAEGRQNLSPSTVSKFAAGLGLSGEEETYFRLLAAAARARTPGEREALAADARRARWERDLHRLTGPAAEDLLRGWHRMVIHAMCYLEGFRADPRWISRRLGGWIAPAQAGEALRFLREGGYVRLRGRRVAGTRTLHIGEDQVSRQAMKSFAGSLHRLAAEPPRGRRGYGRPSVAYVALSRAEAEAFSRKLDACLREALSSLKGKRVEGEVCLVLLDVLPLTEPR